MFAEIAPPVTTIAVFMAFLSILPFLCYFEIFFLMSTAISAMTAAAPATIAAIGALMPVCVIFPSPASLPLTVPAGNSNDALAGCPSATVTV